MNMLNKKIEDYYSGMQPNEYVAWEDEDIIQLRFLCPGCGAFIGVYHFKKPTEQKPNWKKVDLSTLTVHPSIYHTPPHGCRWHGYLKNGVFEGKIESP